MRHGLTHQIVGYDPITGRLEFEHDIPQAHIKKVLRLVPPDADDPDALDAYELNAEQVTEILALLGQKAAPSNLSFFLECFTTEHA